MDTKKSDSQSFLSSLGRNALALFVTYLALHYLIRLGELLRPGTVLPETGQLLAFVIGGTVSYFLAARPVLYFNAIFLPFTISELVLHSIYGLRAVQSGPTHVAVIAAGVIGIVLGFFLHRAPRN